MIPFKQRTRFLLAILAAQLACLAVGFVIQYCFLVALINQDADQSARTEFASAAERLAAEVGRLGPPQSQETSQLAGAISRSFAEHPPIAGTLAVLTDPDWKILRVVPAVGGERGEERWLGQNLTWRSPPPSDAGEALRFTGSARLGDQRCLTTAWQLPGAAGYLVLVRPHEELWVAHAAIEALVPVAGITAWGLASVLSTVVLYMILGHIRDVMTAQRMRVESESLRRIQSLARTRDIMAFGLAKLAESRDPQIGRHLECVSAYAARLASAARRDRRFRNEIDAEFVEYLTISAVLHDIGKMAIEDSILFKAAALDGPERKRMESHAWIGDKFLAEIENRVGTTQVFRMAREIARSHHERWNGLGYPDGLAGRAIPLAARIVALADVYDALSTRRHYKPAYPHDRCVQIIRSDAGRHFDPDLVEIFLSIEDQFRRIADQYGNTACASVDLSFRTTAAIDPGLCRGAVHAGLEFDGPPSAFSVSQK